MNLPAFDVVKRFRVARNGGEGVLSAAELAPIERALLGARYLDPGLPRVVLVGEFKAGKSTLLNALVERDVAPSDVFEMTSWVARYWPAERDSLTIRYHDGREQVGDLEDFVRLCNGRQLSKQELAQIDRVDVSLADTTLPCAIIDCPGLGSTTRENERRLLEAVEEADVALWVIGVDLIGSVRDAALMKKLAAYGLPLRVVLSKCDEVTDPSDLGAILDFIEETLAVPKEWIMATSAKRHLHARTAGGPVDTGIAELRACLAGFAVRGSDVRVRAYSAHEQRLKELTAALLGVVEERLADVEEANSRLEEVLSRVGRTVDAHLQVEILRYVSENLFRTAEVAIERDVRDALRAAGGPLSADSISGVFERHLGNEYLDRFWQSVGAEVTGRLSETWAEKLNEIAGELRAMCAEFEAGAFPRLSGEFKPEVVAARVEVVAGDALATGLKTSIGIAGVASAYAAWLGPLAAQVTIGAAVTGIGIPVALMGAGVSAALWAWRRRSEEEQGEAALERESRRVIDTWKAHFIEGVVKPYFLPRVMEFNRRIEREVVRASLEQLAGGLPPSDIVSLRADVLAARASLRPQLTTT